ncbi:methyltransferase domain-containing protein [uncultured Parvibaculum sp.]|uniref:class I SAM-dependent methyltransferase n=1 Tax=uncultured Parvibaculum sp. TaxID=291828 RepID=UPI0030DBCE5E|tara:strand:- start:15835 stop:16656 length:822 start_codon:yes stop_codon:yes gene_type:complete
MDSLSDIDIGPYLRGEKLIGNDYDELSIQRWFSDEAEGYANLGAKDHESYVYGYHALNQKHGFSQLPDGPIAHALGFGSAYAEELAPILDRLGHITILDPSDQLKVAEIRGIPVSYKKPNSLGVIEFPDSTFDLITCFGVLHHIPNVSYVTSEMGRVLCPGGYLLLREPSVSMGDWRKPRRGLTARERGIPEKIMQASLDAAGLEIISKAYCDFSPLPRLAEMLGLTEIYNSAVLTQIDALAGRLFAWNKRYHRTSAIHSVAPASIFWVCRKS